MERDANPDLPASTARADDEAKFAQISASLLDAVERVLPAWIDRLVTGRAHAWGDVDSDDVAHQARTASADASAAVIPRLRALLETDIDEQRTNPLSLLRDATASADRALAALGVPAVERDEFSRRSFPDDRYGLVPASWDEIDPSLQEIGIVWGAAKAHVFKARRRAEGRT